MATKPKATKPRDVLKELLDIGQELLINQVRLRDSRGEAQVKLTQEAADLHCRLDACLKELGVSLEGSDNWQRQLKQTHDNAHTRGLMLGLVLGAAAAAVSVSLGGSCFFLDL